MKVPFFNNNGSWVRSTPAFEGESLYVAGMRDVLVCLNVKDGRIQWRVDFVKQFETPLPKFGFVCSPLVVGDAVYVQAGVNPETGKVVWSQPVSAFRGMNIQTPVVVGNTLFTSCYGGASILFELKRGREGFEIAEVWRDQKSQGYMSTPVVISTRFASFAVVP